MRLVFALGALAACAIAQTTITAVQDGAAYTSNVSQGGVFVVKGTGLR